VEWDDVKDAVAEQIDTFVNNGGHNWSQENKTKKTYNSLWNNTNPAALKFVVSRMH
jgi:hypothetical protein